MLIIFKDRAYEFDRDKMKWSSWNVSLKEYNNKDADRNGVLIMTSGPINYEMEYNYGGDITEKLSDLLENLKQRLKALKN